MEKSVAEEELGQQIEPTNFTAKLSGSIINVDLMVVDVSIPVKKNESKNCRHFSIRGYVAEMREKNRKTCEPFASGTSKNYLEEQLPPMIVPKHRYWRCEDCLPKISAEYPTKEGRIVSKYWQNGQLSDGNCVSVPSCSDAAVTPYEMQKSAAMEINCQSKIHVDASPPKINAELLASSSSHGDEIGSGNVKNQKIGGEPLISLQLNKEGSVHEKGQNITGPDVHDISTPVEFHKRVNGIADEICLHEKNDTVEDRQEVEHASCVSTNNATNEAVCVGAVHSTRTTTIQVEEQDNASSDSEGILAGYSDHHQHNDNPNGLPRRRTRKVRLLTDLLNEKHNSETDGVRKENTSFSATPITSTGLEKVVAQEAKAPHEDIANGKQSPPRKRKMSPLEDSCSSEIKDITNVSKKVRVSKVSSERPPMTNLVYNSESEESDLSKDKNDRPLPLFKRKALIQVDSDPLGDHVAVGASEKSVRPMDTLPVASTISRRAETKKCFHLFKGKRPLVENGDTFFSPADCSTLGEVPSLTNQADSILSASGRMQFQSENAAPTKVCLDLSLGRPPSSEGAARSDICETNPAFLKQKNRPGRYPYWKDTNFVRQLNVLNNPSSSQFVKKGLMLDLDGRIACTTTGITLEKNCSALFEERGFTLQEKVDGERKNEEVQGYSEASKKQKDPRAYKEFEKGSVDDIPMEIVELMAKNQYERQMAGRESPSISKTTDCANKGFVRVQGNHPMKWLEAQMPSMTNIPHANVTNGIAVAVDNRLAANAKATNFSNADERHFKFHHLGINQQKFFSAVSESQQKLSSGVQYPISGSTMTGSHSSEGATPELLSKNKNVPFGLSVPQKYVTLSNNIEAHAHCAETQHKGRTISDIKSEEMRMRYESQLSLSKPAGGKLYPKPRGSVDPYSNETIPAMQLLSLVHKGISSRTAGSADANRFNEISFSSCDYHQKLSTGGRNKVWDRSFYLQRHQGPGIYCAGENSIRASSLSTGFRGQISFGSQNLEEQIGVTKSQKSFARSGGLQPPCPWKKNLHHGKLKGVLGTSNAQKILPQYGGLENCPRGLDLEANNDSGTSLPCKGTSRDGPCSFNQNPAEFSIPEPGNKYTISGKDLKVLKKDFDQDVSHSANVDSRKRQRPSKVSTGKKQAGHHAS